MTSSPSSLGFTATSTRFRGEIAGLNSGISWLWKPVNINYYTLAIKLTAFSHWSMPLRKSTQMVMYKTQLAKYMRYAKKCKHKLQNSFGKH